MSPGPQYWDTVHTCHAECPCHAGGGPPADFIENAPVSKERELTSDEAAALVVTHGIVAIRDGGLAYVFFDLGDGRVLRLTESNPSWGYERAWHLVDEAL